jgi:hypothetical protein
MESIYPIIIKVPGRMTSQALILKPTTRNLLQNIRYRISSNPALKDLFQSTIIGIKHIIWNQRLKSNLKSRYINRPEVHINNLKNIRNSRPPVEKPSVMGSEITDLYQFEDTMERPYNNDVGLNGQT